MTHCYMCRETEKLWYTYPFADDFKWGVPLCPVHLKMYKEQNEEFMKLLKLDKKGRK